MSAVAIQSARPQINSPPQRPTGAEVAASIERLDRRAKQLGSERINLRTRKQSVEMRLMPMRIRFAILVLEPFLQLAVSPNLIRRKAAARSEHPFAEILVDADDFGGASRL